jgi:pSer/pThr/pTyr-binding forkhead associated (FHA) protein
MKLFVLNGENEGKSVTLRPGLYRIGRSATNDLVISDDKYVSGNHAELKVFANDTVTVGDTGSRNGTYLLGEPVPEPTSVNPGDIVRVGHTFFKLSRRNIERFNDTEDEESLKPEAIMVVDIVGSSKVARTKGDHVSGKIKNSITRKLNKNLLIVPAEYLKSTGNGFMIIFGRAVDSVLFARQLLQDTVGDGTNREYHVRMGIHFGETAKLSDGDRRGMAVDTAFRVVAVQTDTMHETVMGIKKDELPKGDRIFISEAVQHIISENKSITTRSIGFFDLKGLTGRHKIFEII